MDAPRYTSDWITCHIPNWQKWLHEYKNQPAIAAEIGSYEGRSALWLIENILTHPCSEIHCYDPHSIQTDSDIFLSGYNISEVQQRFLHNTQNHRDLGKLHYHQQAIQEGIKTLLAPIYDIIYVDGNHKASDVLSDACHIWPYLKPEGILIFDDYYWVNRHHPDQPTWTPRLGIDSFLKCYETQYALIDRNYQVAIKKLSI